MEEHKNRENPGYDTICKLCREEKEDIVHFTTKCKNLEEVRDYDIIDKNIRSPEERMRVLLFRNKNHLTVGRMLRKLWELRKKLLKPEEKKNPHVQNNSAQGNKESLNAKDIPVSV